MATKRYKKLRRIKQKKSILKSVLRNRFFWIGNLSVLAIAGLLYAIFFSSFFSIENIEIQGNQKVALQNLDKFIEERIPRKIIFFELNHLLLADVGLIAQEVYDAFPEVDSVLVRKKFPDALIVTIIERKDVAIWCHEKKYNVKILDSDTNKMKSFQQCFALDENGIIFEEKEALGQVIVSTPQRSKDAALGAEVIEKDILKTILGFQRELDASDLFQKVGLRVASLTVLSENQVRAKISEGWEFYLNPSENIDWQITKAKLVLQEEVPFEKRALLEYIDLRFGDQAYLKYR